MSAAAANQAPEDEEIVRGLSLTLFSGDIIEHELSVYADLDGASDPVHQTGAALPQTDC